MPSSIHKLLTRLHVPQVALRATKEELLISLGAVAALRGLPQPAQTSPPLASPPPPGVLGQRIAKLAWQTSRLKETRILLSAASALSWSGTMLPSMYDGMCSNLLTTSTLMTAPTSETVALVECVVLTASLAIGSLVAAPEAEDDTTVSPPSSRYSSLTLQHLIYTELPRLDPSGSLVSSVQGVHTHHQLDAVEVLLAAVQHVVVDAPSAQFIEWLVHLIEAKYVRMPGSSTVGAPSASSIARVMEMTQSIAAHLPDAERKRLVLFRETLSESSSIASSNTASTLSPPLWSEARTSNSDDERTNLLVQLRKELRSSDNNRGVTHQALSALLKWCSSIDLRDEVAARDLGRLAEVWIEAVRKAGDGLEAQESGPKRGAEERTQAHELLFYARRCVALRSTCRALEDLLRDASFIGSDARHESTALASLAAPDTALLEWEQGTAPQSSLLFSMLNESHSYMLDQLAAVIFLFPHRSSELQELCGQLRGKLRTALEDMKAAPTEGTNDVTPAQRAHISGKGIGLLCVGLSKCNWGIEPMLEDLCLLALDVATFVVSQPASAVDLQDRARIAEDVLVTAAPLLGHWITDASSSSRLWSAVDTLALAIVDTTQPLTVLGGGALEDTCLQQIFKALGSYLRQSRGRRAKVAMSNMVANSISAGNAAHTTASNTTASKHRNRVQPDEVVIKCRQWFDDSCDHMSKALRHRETTVAATPSKSHQTLQIIASILDGMLAWDRGHERLLDVCAATIDNIWNDQAIPSTLQAASARVLLLQSRFAAPELEMGVERLLRVYQQQPPSTEGANSALLAALVFASVKTGHASKAATLIGQLAAAPGANNLSELLIEGDAILGALTLVGNHSYVPTGTFVAPTEALVGHALDLAERLSSSISSASQLQEGAHRVERVVDLHARILSAARLFCNTPEDKDADASLTALASRVAHLTPSVVSELLASPSVSTAALVTATCERMASLVWSWTPSEFCKALFGIGETQRSGTALVHQLALSSAAEHAVDHVECFHQGSAIARMLLGFAKSHITSRNLFTVFSTRLKIRPLHSTMALPDMSCALQAFGIAKFVDKDMFDTLGRRILAFGSKLTPADVTLTTCAFSRTMLLHRNLYRGLGDRGAQIMEQMPVGAAAAMIAAFGHVGVAHQELGEAAVTKLNLNELSAREAATMLIGLWQMNFDDAQDHFDILANRIAALEGSGLTSKELVGVCSVMHDMQWRHPSLLVAVAGRSAQLMAEADSSQADRLSGDAARAVLDTLGTFGIHHPEARTLLSEVARTVSREAVSMPDDERRLLLSGGL